MQLSQIPIEVQNNPCWKLVKIFYKTENGQPFLMTKGQLEIFEAIAKRQNKRVHINCYTQYGKLLDDNTPILSNRGWITHGNLKIGDYVFGLDGKFKKVLALLNEGEANREISFSNGEIIKCNENHEWIVRHRNRKVWNGGFKKLETKDIERHTIKNTAYNFLIPEISAIDFQINNFLPIDSYTLGVWLGDGKSNAAVICGSLADIEIIKKNIPYNYSSFSEHKKTKVRYYNYGNTDFAKGLSVLGLRNNKHIPDLYKQASYQVRCALIAGLIDTDGTVNSQIRKEGWRNGRIYITNANKILIDDIEEVLYSLGIRNISIVKISACVSSSGIKGKQDIYYLGFSPVIDFPTVLPRKKIIIRNTKRSKTVTITGIKESFPVKGRCINVEGGIYLVGKKLIPTHNSEIVSMAVLTRASTYPEKWAIIAPSTDKAKIIMGNIIRHIFDNEAIKMKFKIDPEESEERIRRERSKSRLTFDVGNGLIGEVFILSAESHKVGEDAGNKLMGFGCIPKGFKIMTNKGKIDIKNVVENKLNVKIASYNHKTNKQEFKEILEYQKNLKINRDILEIETNNTKFQCTDDHPVYVRNKGYIKAKDLKKDDELILYDSNMRNL